MNADEAKTHSDFSNFKNVQSLLLGSSNKKQKKNALIRKRIKRKENNRKKHFLNENGVKKN